MAPTRTSPHLITTTRAPIAAADRSAAPHHAHPGRIATTTGHNCQVITDHAGNVTYISEPMTGHNHDTTVLIKETGTTNILEKEASSSIGDKGYIGYATITPIKNQSTAT